MKFYSTYNKIKVKCNSCSNIINEEEIGDKYFLNIEEDIQGRDLLTFICPICKNKSKSYRYG